MCADSIGAVNATQHAILAAGETMKKAIEGTIGQAARMLPAAARQNLLRETSENSAKMVESMVRLTA